eukprot:354635-Chlamydomonas_euryale.AAC.12
MHIPVVECCPLSQPTSSCRVVVDLWTCRVGAEGGVEASGGAGGGAGAGASSLWDIVSCRGGEGSNSAIPPFQAHQSPTLCPVPPATTPPLQLPFSCNKPSPATHLTLQQHLSCNNTSPAMPPPLQQTLPCKKLSPATNPPPPASGQAAL